MQASGQSPANAARRHFDWRRVELVVTARPPSDTLRDAELPNPPRRADLMAMPISVPSYTVDDLEHFPEDGNRYELLDGVLLVSPAPEVPHQVVTARLLVLLSDLLRPWPAVLVTSPGVIILRPKTQLEPDLLVFRQPTGPLRWENVRDRLLAVETASRSTVVYDRDFPGASRTLEPTEEGGRSGDRTRRGRGRVGAPTPQSTDRSWGSAFPAPVIADRLQHSGGSSASQGVAGSRQAASGNAATFARSSAPWRPFRNRPEVRQHTTKGKYTASAGSRTATTSASPPAEIDVSAGVEGQPHRQRSGSTRF